MPDVNLDRVNITPDELIAQWGEYYIDQGQNMQNLHMLPFEDFGSTDAGSIIATDQTVLREANVRVDEVLQPYQDDFNNKGSFSMLPVDIFLHHAKIDIAIIPNQLKNSYAQFLTSNSLDPVSYPIVAYIMEQYLMKQSRHDLEMKAFFKGVKKAAQQDVAGDAVDIMDGLNKHIKNLEAANKFEFTTIGAWASDPKDFVTQIEGFIQSMPEIYREMEMPLNMNRTMRDKFRRGMRAKYNMNYAQATELDTVMDKPNIKIAGRASMLGCDRVWATPKTNLLIPVKGFSNTTAFDVQKQDRKVKFLSDFWIGAGFVQPELIFSTEHDYA